MKNRLIGWILKAPLILTMIASFGVSVYAAINKLYDIQFGTAIILGIILALYIIGEFLHLDKNHFKLGKKASKR